MNNNTAPDTIRSPRPAINFVKRPNIRQLMLTERNKRAAQEAYTIALFLADNVVTEKIFNVAMFLDNGIIPARNHAFLASVQKEMKKAKDTYRMKEGSRMTEKQRECVRRTLLGVARSLVLRAYEEVKESTPLPAFPLSLERQSPASSHTREGAGGLAQSGLKVSYN